MRLEFSSANTESDVEQFFILPFLKEDMFLSIPETSILTKPSLAIFEIDKGNSKRRYVPDYVVYCEGFPVLIIEAKNPEEDENVGLREAQLYAAELNKRFPSGLNPAKYVASTNGRNLKIGIWDQNRLICDIDVANLAVGSAGLGEAIKHIGWDSLQSFAATLSRRAAPRDWHLPSTFLGENRVNLAKVGHNSLYEEVDPLLRRFFDPKDKAHEEDIIKNAYVTTSEITKYERNFEDFLRTRVIPTADSYGKEIETSKRKADGFSRRLDDLAGKNQPYMQLIIGGVGSGKTSFLKRYFNYIIDDKIREKIVYCRINFNNASDDLEDVRDWMCLQFIEKIRQAYSHIVDMESEYGLRSIFSKEIHDNKGAYDLLRKSSNEKYNERLASDIRSWMEKPTVFARALARAVSGDRGYALVIALDNVDRREREAQLKIFQSGQWFMTETRSVCLMTLRDETFEIYKDEKPLDAFLKTGNFYIRPPRFIDMVASRLDLVIKYLAERGDRILTYQIEGLGEVRYPATSLGTYLTSVYVDLFRKKRRITMILEGLAGRNARKALEMFSAILTSAHFDTRDFTTSALSSGSHHIQENVLIRALMRTNYLYFTPSHGFVRNIYEFPLDSARPSHFLKQEILRFLVANRKKKGDTRYEGYFSVSYIKGIMDAKGFHGEDVVLTINMLVAEDLVISEDLTLQSVRDATSVRVTASGFVHLRLLTARTEYISGCALITHLDQRDLAQDISSKWRISGEYIDARPKLKKEAAYLFVNYLEKKKSEHGQLSAGLIEAEQVGAFIIRNAKDALGFSHGALETADSGEEMDDFDRLFVAT